jgi:hypothetical protein
MKNILILLLFLLLPASATFAQQNGPAANGGFGHTFMQAQTPYYNVTPQQELFDWTGAQTQTRSSAGIFDPTGTLVRTVWTNKAWPSSGSYLWDGNLDNGTPATPGVTYTLRVHPNSLSTQFALIGTTETDWFGDSNWNAASWFPVSGVAVGDNVYVSNFYSEQKMPMSVYNRNYPNTNIRQFPNAVWINTQLENLDTDGQGMIYAMLSAGSASNSLFAVTAVSTTGQPWSFANGSQASNASSWLQSNNYPLPGYYGPQPSPNVCDARYGTPTSLSLQTGMSVTHAASGVIAISHGYSDIASNTTPSPSLDQILLFDKQTCASVGTISVPNPQVQAQDADGNIWVISGYWSGQTGANTTYNTLYEITNPTTSPTVIANPIPGVICPMAIHYDPVTGHIFINDGGTSQQVKELDPVGLTVVSTIGVLGGFGTGASVNAAIDPNGHNNPTFLFDPSTKYSHISGSNGWPFTTSVWTDGIGDVWVGDIWNDRVMHYTRANTSSPWTYVNRIMLFPYSYDVSADYVTGRVFGGMQPSLIEYSVNPSLTIVPGDPDPNLGGNGAWEEKFNWLAPILQSSLPHGMGTTTRQVVTCNGNTIAFYFDNNTGGGIFPVILNTNGTLKIKSTTPDTLSTTYRGVDNQCAGLYGLGVTGTSPNFTDSFLFWPHTGTDANGFPIFNSTYTTVASVSGNVTNGDPIISSATFGLAYFPTTASGNIAVWGGSTNTTSTGNPTYSEGVVSVAGNSWKGKFFPQKLIPFPDGEGHFPYKTSTMSAGEGGYTVPEGHDIFNMYNGNWDMFGCHIYHWYDDGLMLEDIGPMGSFDYPSVGAWTGTGVPQQTGQIPTPSTPYMCGDVAWIYLTPFTDGYIIYHGDENHGKGFAQIKVTGEHTVHTYQGSGVLGQTVTLTQTQ